MEVLYVMAGTFFIGGIILKCLNVHLTNKYNKKYAN